MRNRYFNYFDVRHGESMYLRKRSDKDIWQHLYELPLVETEKELTIGELQKDERFKALFEATLNVKIQYIRQIKHVLSHQIIYAIFYKVEVSEIRLDKDYLKIAAADIDDYPVSRLVHKYLEQL